ncbi:hypothetical protein [Bacillus paralicheniformis]|uniref:hypothetical protein n=1 Tax=Bacillus paralicheniformis TaxID=1648923 RepID=UPI001BDDD8EF|nr:hypothetical protein [Bacillus paralicheniformis]MDR9800571.1 hypothetical protein [Bacillus paralicheniformis]
MDSLCETRATRKNLGEVLIQLCDETVFYRRTSAAEELTAEKDVYIKDKDMI